LEEENGGDTDDGEDFKGRLQAEIDKADRE